MSRPLDPIAVRFEKFSLYETSTNFYLLANDTEETKFRLLKINRAIEKPKDLSEIVNDDQLVYSSELIMDTLEMINEGNKLSGGLTKVCSAVGLVGFVKFLDCFYFTLITQKKEVGCIGGNFIYAIKNTEMFPIRKRDEPETNAFRNIWRKLNKKLNQTSWEIAESRYMGLFQFVDMTKDFFFSYTYDLTYSLQRNYITSARAAKGNINPNVLNSKEIFQWNYYQIQDLQTIVGEGGCQWILPIIHGSFQQRRMSFFGRTLDMFAIARRSRHYAGTRYLKRGTSVHGKVANDCEIEQIIQMEQGNLCNFCSYIQMRGSIPTYWSQETSVTTPRPPIVLNRVDPNYLATEEHFADMFRRYSSPIIVLDLVKHQEKRPRESIIGKEFRQAIEVLNESIDVEHKIRYIALDYSKITSISKSKNKGKHVGEMERAMAVVGSEWATMESALVSNKSASSPIRPTARSSSTIRSDAMVSDGMLLGSDSIDDNDNDSVSTVTATSNTGGEGSQMASPILAAAKAIEKIDVLRELEDIASVAITETSFFCNSLRFVENCSLVGKDRLEKAKSMGYLQQKGVIRTNCVDCLDRTNGGQFAVAMKFLSVSLQSLGLIEPNASLEPTSQMLLTLMDMFAELGDKIALQYGGSEAHNKVLAGKSGQAASSSKQNELLTSIKRYYSNAFTDMVKQDAMNVFLGCFVPNEANIPLWDLDSDYHLHNKALRPPDPYLNKVFYDQIISDNKSLLNPVVKQINESAIKRVLYLYLDQAKAQTRQYERTPFIFTSPLPNATNTETLLLNKLCENPEIMAFLRRTKLPYLDLAAILRKYYIRSIATAERSSIERPSSIRGSSFSNSIGSLQPLLLPELIDNRPSFQSIRNAEQEDPPTFNSKERVLRGGQSPNVLRDSIQEQQIQLKGTSSRAEGDSHSNKWGKFRSKKALYSAVEVIARLERRKLLRKNAISNILHATELWWKNSLNEFDRDLYGDSAPVESTLDPDIECSIFSKPSYFDRVYKPNELSEFDVLLQLDFFSPIDAVENQLNPDSEEIVEKNNDLRSKSIDFRTKSTVDELPPADADGGDGSADSGFHLARYIRDLSVKARNLVGGFLRKEESAVMPVSSNNDLKANRSSAQEKWKYHHISHHEHEVSRKSMLLYSDYVHVYENRLVLLEETKLSKASEEDYCLLLRDYLIHIDNVSGMEQLSVESYVSNVISKGIYMGMTQNSSAWMAYSFLYSALAFIESELQPNYRYSQAVGLQTQASSSNLTVGAVSETPITKRSSALAIPNFRGSPVNLPSASGVGSNLPYNSFFSSTSRPVNIASKRFLEVPLGKSSSLDISPILHERIRKLARMAGVEQGMENELRKIVSNYIFQQSLYSRELSDDRLSRRMSSLSSEKSVIQYCLQFERDTLASALDSMNYIMSDKPGSKTYSELHQLQKSVAGILKHIRSKRKQLLSLQAAKESESAAVAVKADKPEDTAVVSSSNTSGNPIQSEYTEPTMKQEGGSSQQVPRKPVTVTESLGLTYDVGSLGGDLSTDYSLDIYNYHYHYDAISSSADKVQMYGQHSDYPGFSYVSADVYSRIKNPFMLVNEIGAIRFNETLYSNSY